MNDAVEADAARFGPGSQEALAAHELGERLGVVLRPRRLALRDGTVVEVEGTDVAGTVVVQFVLNTGAVRSSLRNKVAADLFKLVWIRTSAIQGARAVLCVSPTVATLLAGRGWLAAAARDLDIEVVVSGA